VNDFFLNLIKIPMGAWYQVKFTFQQQDDRGNMATLNEINLFDAVTYTDAEARATEFWTKDNAGAEFKLEIKRVHFSEIFEEEADGILIAGIYYKVRVVYLVFDERSQKEKEVPFTMLVLSSSVDDCYKFLTSKLGEVQDYRITKIEETKIIGVYKYESEDEHENTEVFDVNSLENESDDSN
jgi:hypothetical protein